MLSQEEESSAPAPMNRLLAVSFPLQLEATTNKHDACNCKCHCTCDEPQQWLFRLIVSSGTGVVFEYEVFVCVYQAVIVCVLMLMVLVNGSMLKHNNIASGTTTMHHLRWINK